LALTFQTSSSYIKDLEQLPFICKLFFITGAFLVLDLSKKAKSTWFWDLFADNTSYTFGFSLQHYQNLAI
jgi:hypothetical protein